MSFVTLFAVRLLGRFNEQVILSQTDVVKPRAVDINDNVQLSDEVREQCNIAEERVREARPLEQVCTKSLNQGLAFFFFFSQENPLF